MDDLTRGLVELDAYYSRGHGSRGVENLRFSIQNFIPNKKMLKVIKIYRLSYSSLNV